MKYSRSHSPSLLLLLLARSGYIGDTSARAAKERSHTIKRKIVFGMLGLLASLALIEGSVELMLNNPEHVPDTMIDFWRSYYYSKDQPIVQYLPECAQYDPELTYTLRPGRCRFQSRYFNTWIEANRLGTRDDERSLSGPEVIVIGDSESMGWGVEQDELYSEIIEQESGRTVLNLAVSSYGTARELQLLVSVRASI